MITKPFVYIASGFFNSIQLNQVEEIEKDLDSLSLSYFSPRQGENSKKLGSNPSPIPRAILNKYIFDTNIKMIDACDFMVINLEGLDSGTLFELGVSLAFGKPYKIVNIPEGLEEKYSEEVIENWFSTAFYPIGNREIIITDLLEDNKSSSGIFLTHEVAMQYSNLENISLIAESVDYCGYSKILLGYYYARYGKSVKFFDIMRKSNLMLTESTYVYKMSELENSVTGILKTSKRYFGRTEAEE